MRTRYNFPIESGAFNTTSQSWQDLFVLSLHDGKINGTYLEIGANEPVLMNNSYNLSTQFGWKGVSIEFDPQYKPLWKKQRPKDKFILDDALLIDYQSLLKKTFGKQKTIDYLQCDIEPCTNTFEVLKRLPHDEYRFGVITFETDLYTGGPAPKVREESRKFLADLGYTLIVGDVLTDCSGTMKPYEDWYVDLNLVNVRVAKSIQNMAELTQNSLNLLIC